MSPLAKKLSIYAFVVYLSWFAYGIQVNQRTYCDPGFCNGTKHITCIGQQGQYGPYCMLNSRLVCFDQYVKNDITNHLNLIRDEVSRYNNAAEMSTLVWDEELAFLADSNVRQCQLSRNFCQNTEVWKNVGQTLAYRGVNYQTRHIVDTLTFQMNMWWREGKAAPMKDILNYTDNSIAPNFFQLVYDKSQNVGCAALQQYKYGWIQTFFACNFDNAPIVGKPVFVQGKSPGENCKGGMNPTFKHLCKAGSKTGSNDAENKEDKETTTESGKDPNGKKNETDVTELDQEKLQFKRLLDKIEKAVNISALYNIQIKTFNHIVSVYKETDNNTEATQSKP